MVKNKKGKKFYEIFKVTKKGKEKIIKVEGFEKEEQPTKKQIIQENKILRNMFIGVGIILVVSLVFYFTIDNIRNFKHEGIEFEVVSFCDTKPCLILYQTKLPVILESGEKAEYNIYLRKDPRKIGEMIFDGELKIYPDLVIDSEKDFNCDGDGIIAVANIVNLYEVIGTNVIKNKELTCELSGENYAHLQLVEGDETKIEKVGPACYRITINNCEILEGTERFILETLNKVNKMLENGS